jgi:hypothetical protein
LTISSSTAPAACQLAILKSGRTFAETHLTPLNAGVELLPAWRVTHNAGYAAVIGTGRQLSEENDWRPTELQPGQPERRKAMSGPSDQLRAISWRNTRIVAEQVKAQFPFRHRGLSGRTIQAPVDCSIDSPERLLFMTEKEIQSIPGIGKVSLAEIIAYRDKFIR